MTHERRIQCFLLEPTTLIRQILRRYTNAGGECSHIDNHGYHDNSVIVSDIEATEENSCGMSAHFDHCPIKPEDPRWPTNCRCGYRFPDTVEKQYHPKALYKRSDTGELTTLQRPPVGAMWFADWMSDNKEWCGPDGRCLVVQTPGGQWMVDSRCSNCTLPNDKVHKCWVRHGEAPNVTVDKNGVTCAAGAGSIICGNYHGFLRNGYLEEC